jgi:hypothetical protein
MKKYIDTKNIREIEINNCICPVCEELMNWNRYKDLYAGYAGMNDDGDDISFSLEIYICQSCKTKYIKV